MLSEIYRDAGLCPKITMLYIGASEAEGGPEPFAGLADDFPGSRIIAIDVNEAECQRLNEECRTGTEFFPLALGRTEEERPFYQTEHPMCSSLYRPNAALIDRFHGMEGNRLKSVLKVRTVSLDWFSARHEIGPVDFIKIDIQGAELDVFKGGMATLKDVIAIVSEAEFVPLYEDQPLFGDLCAFLAQQRLVFHKVIYFGGRTLKPVWVEEDPYMAVQHLWSDAMFLRELAQPDALTDDQLLKTALIAEMYKSFDVAWVCLMAYDERAGTQLAQAFGGSLG
jgi:FkbM family methyltransferase